MTTRLTAETFNKALIILQRDPDLHKSQRVWQSADVDRPGGFRTLVLLILEQQVSLASARAAFDKLTAVAGKLTPNARWNTDAEFRGAGVSRQEPVRPPSVEVHP